MAKLKDLKDLETPQYVKELHIDFDSEAIKVDFKIKNTEPLTDRTIKRIGLVLQETVDDITEILTSNFMKH